MREIKIRTPKGFGETVAQLMTTFPYARFPAWIGIYCVLGFSHTQAATRNIGTYAVNIAAMVVCAGASYFAAGLRRRSLQRYAD